MGITIHASFLPYNHPDALTADLDGTFARLQASGADVVQEPTQQPYGGPRLRLPQSRGQPDPHQRAPLSRPAIPAMT
jgi:hypothetical protein